MILRQEAADVLCCQLHPDMCPKCIQSAGDMIVVDVHIEVEATQTVEAGHNIAVLARARVMQRHRVISLLTHVDPAQRPDLDHLPVA